MFLNDDGSFLKDDKVVKDNSYDIEGLLHVGNSNQVSKNGEGDNWYGNYLGPDNPESIKHEDYYSVPPINDLDYAAYNHDKGYDKVNAVGIKGALFASRTKDVDNKLVGDCGYIAFYSTPYKRKWYWAVGASSLFSVLSFYKHVIF